MMIRTTASPVAESGPWSLGTLVGLPLAVVSVIALTVVGVLVYRRFSDRFEAHLLGGGALALALLIAALTASPLGMYPYGSEFHQWRDVTGTVESVDSRLIADGNGGMSERYIFTIDGHPFGVDDTRAAVAEKGDTVTLRCKREWQYAANSGWGCRWAGVQ